MISALIAFISVLTGSLLTIMLTQRLQHYFWLTLRHAELCLADIEDCAKLIAEFAQHLPEILHSKNLTDEDRDLFLRWNKLSLEIHALFAKCTVDKFTELDRIIDTYSGHYPSEVFDNQAFLQARFTAMITLYKEIGLTGEQLHGTAWW